MKPLSLLVTVAALVGLGLLAFAWWPKPAGPEQAPSLTPVAQSTATAGAPAAREEAVVAATEIAATPAKSASVDRAPARPTPQPPARASKPLDQTVQLDRMLPPSPGGTPHTVELDGSQRTIVGTRQMTDGGLTQTVVALRDAKSGQVEFVGEGLQFKVQDAATLQVLQQAYPKMTVLSATQAYVNVRIDAADLAAYLGALQHDTRVANVTFLPLIKTAHLK